MDGIDLLTEALGGNIPPANRHRTFTVDLLHNNR